MNTMDDPTGTLSRASGEARLGTAQGPGAQVAGLAAAISSEGGIDGLLGKLRQGGLGPQVDSWVGGGPNEAVAPEQLAGALGDDTIQKLAATSGLSIQSLLPLLATFLPQIVDMLTPAGKEPPGGVNEAAKQRGPDLGGLLGGVLGRAGGAGAAGGTPDLGGLLGNLLGGDDKR